MGLLSIVVINSMNRQMSRVVTLQEQTEIYRQVFAPFEGRRVVVRTLDAGADKPLSFADLGPEGVRVNAISAGPIKTLAASGIRGFKSILGAVEEKTPLRRNVTQQDVGSAALFLCSELGNGVTGEVLYVDSGYHIMGL